MTETANLFTSANEKKNDFIVSKWAFFSLLCEFIWLSHTSTDTQGSWQIDGAKLA